jgi:hypothetical protein
MFIQGRKVLDNGGGVEWPKALNGKFEIYSPYIAGNGILRFFCTSFVRPILFIS